MTPQELRDLTYQIKYTLDFDSARDAIREYLEHYDEILNAATEIQFKNGYIQRLGRGPYEYGVVVDGNAGRGDYSSMVEAYEAFKD